jgi:hypothetical protein
LSIRRISEQPSILDPLSQLRHEPIVVNSIEEFRQIEADDPLVSCFQMLSRLGDRCVTASPRSKTVA